MRRSRLFFPLAVAACILCTFPAFSNATRISLRKAMSSQLITVNAVSNGGYCGKSIMLDCTNNSPAELDVFIDPGLIFVPQDTLYQNLVLLGNETIAMAPHERKSVSLQTFCGKSYAASPRQGINYHFMRQGDTNMVNMLTYVRERHIPIHLAQKAVWVFTNGQCLNTVFSSEEPSVSEDFVRYMATVRHSRIPEFFIDYQLDNTPGHSAIATDKEKVYATMHWGLADGYRHMYVTVYRENGSVYRTIEADKVIDKDGYTVSVAFDPAKDPKGAYYVRLHDDENKVWDQKRVIIGIRPCDLM